MSKVITPMGGARRIPILSFSALNDYRICPRRFLHKYVLKDLPCEQKTPAQLDGTAAHEALRKRIQLREPLPVQFKAYEPLCGALLEQDGAKLTELKLGVMANGQPCDFFDPSVWLRGALDFVLIRITNAHDAAGALILDWKTGKQREDPFELAIQALLLRAKYPEFKRITGRYFWLKENFIGVPHEKVNNTELTWQSVCQDADSIARRVQTNDWPPDEGPLCAWCPVTKDKCEFRK